MNTVYGLPKWRDCSHLSYKEWWVSRSLNFIWKVLPLPLRPFVFRPEASAKRKRLVTKRKGPWKGERREAKRRLVRFLLPAFLYAQIFIEGEAFRYNAVNSVEKSLSLGVIRIAITGITWQEAKSSFNVHNFNSPLPMISRVLFLEDTKIKTVHFGEAYIFGLALGKHCKGGAVVKAIWQYSSVRVPTPAPPYVGWATDWLVKEWKMLGKTNVKMKWSAYHERGTKKKKKNKRKHLTSQWHMAGALPAWVTEN